MKEKKRRLSKLIIDMIPVFLGVSIAFAFDSWKENQVSDEIQINTLNEIKSALSADLIDLNVNLSAYKKKIRCAAYTIENLDSTASQEVFSGDCFYLTFRDLIFTPHQAAYETLKSRGVSVIENDSLRNLIVDLYDFDYTNIVKLEEQYLANDPYQLYLGEILNELAYMKFSYKNDSTHLITSLDFRFKDLAKLKKNNKLAIVLEEIQFNSRFQYGMYIATVKKVNQIIKNIDIEIKNIE